ncbi:MAG: nuclear transport factor 2 family protein [bacterium]|nr:nuclear transport factor 2 family protein [bacterium]
MTMFRNVTAIFIILVGITAASAQVDAEREAIKRTALNYAEGWYEGDADKMESALSPDLAKRIARTNAQNQTRLDHMTAMALVQGTRGGFGKQTPTAEQQKDVTIFGVTGGAGTA